jgi:hypothetical protein
MNTQARGEPSVPEPDAPENAAVTGVAKGSLGTGTALEDTQEWVIPPELRAAAAPDERGTNPAPVAAAAAASAQAAAERPIADASMQAAEPAPAETVVRPSVRAARRIDSRSRGGFAATPRAAGLAAVVLLALVGVAAVVTSQDRTVDAGAGSAPVDQATLAPTAAPPADAGGGNGGNGKDKKDKNEGGGNGKGNGGRND